jgi:hypothetical protein
MRTGIAQVAETVEAERFLESFCTTLGLPWIPTDLAALHAV